MSDSWLVACTPKSTARVVVHNLDGTGRPAGTVLAIPWQATHYVPHNDWKEGGVEIARAVLAEDLPATVGAHELTAVVRNATVLASGLNGRGMRSALMGMELWRNARIKVV